MSLSDWLALIIIAGALVGVAVGRYYWLRMNRTTIALVGATLLNVIGALTLGAPIPLTALAAASLSLITRRLKPRRIFRELDWSLSASFGLA